MHRWWGIFWVAVLTFAPAVVVAASTSENYSLDGVEWSGSVQSSESQSDQFSLTPSGGTTTDTAATSQAVSTQSPPDSPTTPSAPPALPSSPPGTQTDAPSQRASGLEALAATVSDAVATLRESITPVVNEPVVQASATTANVTTALATAIAVAAPLVANAPLLNPLGQLLAWLQSQARFLGQLFTWMMGLGARPRRRSEWGTVRDAESNQPLPLVLVRALRQSDGKLVSSALTDHQGRFSLVASAGTYVLAASKGHYQFPSKLSQGGYHGEPILVRTTGTIAVDCFLDPNVGQVSRRLWQLGQLETVSRVLQPMLLTVGSGFAVVYAIAEPTTLHLATVAAYGLLFVGVLVSRFRHTQSVSRVVNRATNQGIQLAIVRLFNATTKQLIATRVSDRAGQLTFAIAPGQYQSTATHPQFTRFASDVWDESGRSVALRRTFVLDPVTAGALSESTSKKTSDTTHIDRQVLAGGVVIERGPNFPSLKRPAVA